jgi:hypothetical protein
MGSLWLSGVLDPVVLEKCQLKVSWKSTLFSSIARKEELISSESASKA